MSIYLISIPNSQEVKQKMEAEEESEQMDIRDHPNNARYLTALHMVSILGLNTLLLMPQSLIPRHNSVYYPEYRYELMRNYC